MVKPSTRSRFPLPTVINPPQRRCVTFNIPDDLMHIGNFWGAVQKLAQTMAYENDEARTAKQVSAVWLEIIEEARTQWLAHECGGLPEDGNCTDYNPCSGLITYEPGNPCTQPEFVPTGYLFPPFFIIEPQHIIPIALGAKVGDVWTDLTRLALVQIPLPIPGTGFPRFRISFEVPAVQDVTLELHFVKVPGFGYVLISQDNALDPLPEFANLNRDIIAAPPETNLDIVIERKFVAATVGTHWVDVTVVPWVDLALDIPLHFGACFRKFVLCGKDFSVPVPEMQFVDCKIRFRPSSTAAWQEFDISNCVNTLIDEGITDRLEDGTLGGSQPGAGGELPPTFCKVYQVTLPANGSWIAPIPVKAEYTITTSNFSGLTHDGTASPLWICPSGKEFLLGTCANIGRTNASNPMPALDTNRVIMRYNATYFDAFEVAHEVSPGLVGAFDLVFQPNDVLLSDNLGDVKFTLEICNNQTFGLYEEAAGQSNITITLIGTNKWHVDVPNPFDGAPAFMQYGNLTLRYGRISPLPQTQLCRKWLVTNMVGWTDDPEVNVFTADNFECVSGGGFLSHTNPVIKNGECSEGMYSRSATPFSFDVEIVDDCP